MTEKILTFSLPQRLMAEMRKAIYAHDVKEITRLYYEMWPGDEPTDPHPEALAAPLEPTNTRPSGDDPESPRCKHCHMPLHVCQSEEWERLVVNRTVINLRWDTEAKVFVAEFPRKLTQAETRERAIESLKSIVKWTAHLFLTGELPSPPAEEKGPSGG